MEGAGPVDDDPDSMDSFRGGLIGALSLVYFVQALLDYFGDPEEQIELKVHCNNKAVNSNAGTPITGRGLKGYWKAEYDALAEIHVVEAEL